MKPTLFIAAIVTLAAATGPLPATAEDFQTGEVNLGVNQLNVDTDSSKFLEYRDVPSGVVAPYFRLFGQKGDFRYDFLGSNIRQDDQRYRVKLGNDKIRVEGDYNEIPHRFGNDGHTLLQETSEGVWQLSNTLQGAFQGAITAAPRPSVNYAFLSKLVGPSLDAANHVDLKLERERGNVAVRLTPTKAFDVRVTYFHERRVGDRSASGTSFGFGNVVELPETVHYVTQDFGAEAQYNGSWGVVRAGLHYNWFNNGIESLSFDNPFRVTDSTDASAYTAPGSGSIGGPSHGLMALPPDNKAWVGNVGATFKLHEPTRTRLNVDASYGDFTQDQSPFIPYTTNTAITPTSNPAAPFVAANPANLPAQHLDGKIKRTSFAATFTSRPADKLSVNARFRLYETTNDTTRLSFPGYTRFDGVWEAIPRISVPYDYKNQRFDATANYDFGEVTLEAGYRHTGFDRSYRETEKTKENAFVAAAILRGGSWALLRASYEKGTRGYEGLEIERSEDGSQVKPGAPANLLAIPAEGGGPVIEKTYASFGCGGSPCNIRFDQAHKKVDKIGANLQLTPGNGNATFAVGYFRTNDDYDQSRYGLLSAKYDTVTVEADWSPGEKTSVYAFYTYEKQVDAQRGRQSGAAVSFTTLDDWTSNVNDKTNSFGAGGKFTLKPEKWYLDLFGRYQEVNGNNDIASPTGGAPELARRPLKVGITGIPAYDDTKIWTLNAELRYQFAKAWTFGLGGFYEEYTISDSNSLVNQHYVPGSFFLVANDGDYKAKVGYVRVSYRW
jgi:MtrB/PioB family decaheme-associated outer membrane protein